MNREEQRKIERGYASDHSVNPYAPITPGRTFSGFENKQTLYAYIFICVVKYFSLGFNHPKVVKLNFNSEFLCNRFTVLQPSMKFMSEYSNMKVVKVVFQKWIEYIASLFEEILSKEG